MVEEKNRIEKSQVSQAAVAVAVMYTGNSRAATKRFKLSSENSRSEASTTFTWLLIQSSSIIVVTVVMVKLMPPCATITATAA